jgi:hypothetical protein
MDRKLTTAFGDPIDDSQNKRSDALGTAAVTYDIGKYAKAKTFSDMGRKKLCMAVREDELEPSK